MNYAEPRQIGAGPLKGKWHWTVKNDDRIWAAGYCSMLETGSQCEGHDTPEEAAEHYRQYMLDKRLSFDHTLADAQRHCEECHEWTQGLAQIGSYTIIVLCKKHQTREIVEKHYPVSMGAIYS